MGRRKSLVEAQESLLREDSDADFNAILEEVRTDMGYTQTVEELRLVWAKTFRRILAPSPEKLLRSVVKALQSENVGVARTGQAEIDAYYNKIKAINARFPVPLEEMGHAVREFRDKQEEMG